MFFTSKSFLHRTCQLYKESSGLNNGMNFKLSKFTAVVVVVVVVAVVVVVVVVVVVLLLLLLLLLLLSN